jgi:DNA polymerase IV
VWDPRPRERLGAEGVTTIGGLAARPIGELRALFGKNGEELWERARGIDERPIETEHEAKSISQETTFARDVSDRAVLLATLQRQAEKVAQRVQKTGVHFTTVKIKLRWPDFTTLTRQTSLSQPTEDGSLLYSLAEGLFLKEWQPGKAVRLLGVGVSGLVDAPRQLGLWDSGVERDRRLQEAVEEIKEKFGDKVIGRGTRQTDG